MSLTAEERRAEVERLKRNGWEMTEGRDAIVKTFMFKVSENIDRKQDQACHQ